MNKTYLRPAHTHRSTLGFWLAIGMMALTVGSVDAFAQQSGTDTNQGRGPQGMDFQGMDFQGMDFQGMDFQGMDFQGPILSSGLAGEFIMGALPNGDNVELAGGFRGHEVDATVWDANTDQPTTITLHAQDLVGMVWQAPLCFGEGCIDTWYRVAFVAPDLSQNTMPGRSSNTDIWLYRVEYTLDVAGNVWNNVCANTDTGMFVSGTWNDDGTYNSVGQTFSCMTGVVSKCARGWGYKPWLSLATPDGTLVDLQPLYKACTRAARADYCGDGVTHTLNGLLIDMFDIYGFNVPEAGPGFTEEASFDGYGALSLRHTRVPNHPNELQCRADLPPTAPADESPLLWVWSHPTPQQP